MTGGRLALALLSPLLVGCGGAMTEANDAATRMEAVGAEADRLLRSVCVDGYQDASGDRAKREALDAYCLDAADAFDAWRASHVALAALLEVGTADAATLGKAVADLALATELLGRAIGKMPKAGAR